MAYLTLSSEDLLSDLASRVKARRRNFAGEQIDLAQKYFMGKEYQSCVVCLARATEHVLYSFGLEHFAKEVRSKSDADGMRDFFSEIEIWNRRKFTCTLRSNLGHDIGKFSRIRNNAVHALELNPNKTSVNDAIRIIDLANDIIDGLI